MVISELLSDSCLYRTGYIEVGQRSCCSDQVERVSDGAVRNPCT